MAGAGAQGFAEKYGIHRDTVFAHLCRREILCRRPGFNDDEQVETIRLAGVGMAMQAIGRHIGVGRRAVRGTLSRLMRCL